MSVEQNDNVVFLKRQAPPVSDYRGGKSLPFASIMFTSENVFCIFSPNAANLLCPRWKNDSAAVSNSGSKPLSAERFLWLYNPNPPTLADLQISHMIDGPESQMSQRGIFQVVQSFHALAVISKTANARLSVQFGNIYW